MEEEEDVIEFAQKALKSVSFIAIQQGLDKRSSLHAEVGAELFILASSLDDAVWDHEARVRQRVFKLLRDVEHICRWPQKPLANDLSYLEAVAFAPPGSKGYTVAECNIIKGLEAFVSEDHRLVSRSLRHLKKFQRRSVASSARDTRLEDNPSLKVVPYDYPDRVNLVLYTVLSANLRCTCTLQTEGTEAVIGKRHSTTLLLRHTYAPTSQEEVPFDMLISSAPTCYSQHRQIQWQDVQVLVSLREKSAREKKRVKIMDIDDDLESQPRKTRRFRQIVQGRFCQLIRQDFGSRLRLMIQNQELQQLEEWEPRKQLVERLPGIPLTTILRQYRLTNRMKVALAYIIARSMWQFYGSDWMKTKWTSETIYFMSELCSVPHDGSTGVFAWKPYFSVRFGEADANFDEFSSFDGEIHRNPRVLALGVMLVEIGMGIPIREAEDGLDRQTLTAKMNEVWTSATRFCGSKQALRELDIPVYWAAAKSCLDPGIFSEAPWVAGTTSADYQDVLDSRRRILYEEVVHPLENLFQKTGWASEVTAIEPMEQRARPQSTSTSMLEPLQPENVNDLRGYREAKRWLKRMDKLNSRLDATSFQPSKTYRPVRIAVLDTGCNDDSPFFHPWERRNRLRKWKDWTATEAAQGESPDPQDTDGHGTYMVSLIMRVAPHADVYVARVAKDSKSLLDAGPNVAKAIEWAHSEWDVDIISMSFGFEEAKLPIKKAIHRVLNERDDGVLLFAAASNSGANAREMFPARHESVISIRATNARQDFADFNPPRAEHDGIVFGTLGLNVPSASLGDQSGEEFKSGTSVATAVAVGIAGVALEYVFRRPNMPGFEVLKGKLGTRNGMMAMFKAMATRTMNEGYYYVAPWRLEGGSDDERWALFVAALRDVL